MSTTTVPSTTAGTPVPTYQVGDRVGVATVTDVRAGRGTWDTPTGLSQNVLTSACPPWCHGHNPAQAFETGEQLEQCPDFWGAHAGPDWGLTMHTLTSHGRGRRAAAPAVDLSVEAWRSAFDWDDWHEAAITMRVGDGTPLTAPEARSLAAALLRMADLLEDLR